MLKDANKKLAEERENVPGKLIQYANDTMLLIQYTIINN